MLSSWFGVETKILTFTSTPVSIMLRMLNIIIIMLLDTSLLSTKYYIAGVYTKQPLNGKLVSRLKKKLMDQINRSLKNSVYLNFIVENLAIVFLVCVSQKN